ncbi:glycosyltransferase [Geodermatophilus sp. URMC 61]|uniref:glycosyltransferase n=1 Tax=Geodermatophilus sp. URMC 61 TaxID=3423411 RepID=UPI00406CA3E6
MANPRVTDDVREEIDHDGRPGQPTICVVGSGSHFLSGISYYTHGLTTALATRFPTSAILMRRLIPSRLYPGRSRVGQPLSTMTYPASVPVLDGLDWFWGRSMWRTLRFLRRQRPTVLVLQWWTGAVLHSYHALARAARRAGARIVIEFHEVQDVGEQRIPLVSSYVDVGLPRLLRLADGFVVHSEFDRAALERRFGLGGRPVALIPHGPYQQYTAARRAPRAPGDPCRLLYFGVIRPFKGVEDLLEAWERLSDDEVAGYHLTVVGETWEGCTRPAELIAASRHRDRITFVNRYVTDQEAGEFFADADVVVLPYHRSSSSGPLHVAMAQGLPVVLTAVGGLVEAAGDYEGAVFVPPRDPQAIRRALPRADALRGRRFPDPHSWTQTTDRYAALIEQITTADIAAVPVGGLR